MARIPKRALLRNVEQAVLASGWSFLHISDAGQHPARYQIYKNGTGYKTKIYIWNVTHGGGAARSATEYRIQITGIPASSGRQEFVPEIGGKTLILGWWDEVGIFAAWDFSKHSGLLGSSPSLQISEETLRSAHMSGFAPQNKGNGELAIAFRPDYIATYIENLESLHQSGEASVVTEVLDRLGRDPESVDEPTIERLVPAERRYGVIATKRALRDRAFSNRVLTAYGRRCAMCGIQLELLDAAHILDASHPDSTDETCNGIALCTLHHRAFDRAFVTFDTNYRIHLNEDMADQFATEGIDGGIREFRSALKPLINLPPDTRDRPDARFVAVVNSMRGWSVA